MSFNNYHPKAHKPKKKITNKNKSTKIPEKKNEEKGTMNIPLIRPSTSNVRARRGGQPGHSIVVVRGIFLLSVKNPPKEHQSSSLNPCYLFAVVIKYEKYYSAPKIFNISIYAPVFNEFAIFHLLLVLIIVSGPQLENRLSLSLKMSFFNKSSPDRVCLGSTCELGLKTGEIPQP
jgi:hypothetical protein